RGAGRHVLDAQWVLGGSAVLVLLEDGEWGVFDLEGHGPKPQSASKGSVTPTLGSLFTFAIRGHFNDGSNTFQSDDADAARIIKGSKPATLAPTTPSTRRMRQENLFAGPLRHAEGPAKGGISLVPDQDSKIFDEAAVVWYNDSITVIPSLRTYWVGKLKGSGNLFGNGTRGEARTINNVSLRGERRTDVALLPASHHSMYGDAPERDPICAGHLPIELLASDVGEPVEPTIGSENARTRRSRSGRKDKIPSTVNKKTELNKLPANRLYQQRKRKVGFADI
ncbi:MAG: hypothetical protein Q9211_000159, partial [Gyalolechia sp. 1 TL-2023]